MRIFVLVLADNSIKIVKSSQITRSHISRKH